jgi:hypothetical protein
MPRLSEHRVPAYCKHKRSGRAVVYLDGQEIQLGDYGTAASREKYNRLMPSGRPTDASFRQPRKR